MFRGGEALPKARRFPVRISLDELADFLASGNPDAPNSLFTYVLQRIEERAEQKLERSDLHRWLAEYPWLLVLDGLDEVPPSANRREVLEKIQEFWIDVGDAGGDVLVIATTRPQGYNDDFSPKYYRYKYLSPLSHRLAIRYAERLVMSRYPHDAQMQNRILKRLTKACEQEDTARLMRSPLQVTIMAALVVRIGVPPSNRYRLFHDFYRVIYDRERERQVATISAILTDYQSHADAIHRATGWADENQFRVHQIIDPIFVPNYWHWRRQSFFSLEPIVRDVFWSIQALS